MSPSTREAAASRFQRLESIFHRAAELEGAAQQEFLDKACDEASELRREEASELRREEASELRREVVQLLASAADPEGDLGKIVENELAEWTRRSTPSRIGPYRILELLGQGGTGEVYLAERDDEHFQKRVAIKWIRPELGTAEIGRRFRFERQILASLEHPNIARILDGGTAEGAAYLVMELVEGRPLLEYCEAQEHRVEERLKIFLEVCEAVHYAHQSLVLHCDLKPSNILVDRSGHVKLVDFGIAKVLASDSERLVDESSPRTLAGARPLTPEYASPEQAQYLPLTTRSDVYSLGVVLYELLTGRRPYRIDTHNPLVVAQRILEEEPLPPRAVVSRLEGRGRRGGARWGRDLDSIVLKALRKDSEERYGSVEQLAEDLRRYLDFRPVLARRGNLLYRWGRWLRRHRMGVAALGVVLTSLTVATVVTDRQARVAKSERVRAESNLERAEEEKERAEAVVDLLVSLFETSDPALARGSTVTAREILDRGSHRLLRQLEEHPKIRAALAGTVGRVYRELAIYGPAEQHLRESLELRLRHLEASSPEVVDSLHQLAVLQLEQNQIEEAERLLDRALALETETRGIEGPNYGRLLRTRALVALTGGDQVQARQFLAEALRLAGTGKDVDPAAQAEIWDLLGRAEYEEGQWEKAEALYSKGEKLRRAVFGNLHPQVAISLNNVAAARQMMGDVEGVRTALEETLEMRRQLFGDRHGAVAHSLHNLAANRMEAGELEVAVVLLDESDAILKELYDPDHIVLADNLYTRARLESRRRRTDLASDLYQRAADIQRRKLGGDHPKTAQTLMGLADLKRGSDPSEAAALYREVYGVFSRVLERDDYRVAQPLERLGTLLCRESPKEGSPLLIEALAIRRRSANAGHWSTALGQARLGRCLLGTDPARAIEELRSASAALKKAFGGSNALTQRVDGWLLEATSGLPEATGMPEE